MSSRTYKNHSIRYIAFKGRPKTWMATAVVFPEHNSTKMAEPLVVPGTFPTKEAAQQAALDEGMAWVDRRANCKGGRMSQEEAVATITRLMLR